MTYRLRSCQALVASTVLALVLLPLGGCKEKEPEHVRQARERAAAHAKRQLALKQGKAKPIADRHGQAGHDPHGHDPHGHGTSTEPQPLPLEHVDTTKWPQGLRALTVSLVSARPHQVPTLALAIAHHGMPGYDALRIVVRQTTQPKTKRAFLSMLLAEGHMFQPDELAKMAREALLPYLQRAAIDHLAQLKDPYSQTLLQQVAASEKPMADFIARANKRPGVSYKRAQLAALDGILNAGTTKLAKERLTQINDFELEKGLFGMLRIKVARPVVKGLIAKRLVMLALRGDRERLRDYARDERNPPLVRVAAAQALITSKQPADQKALAEIAARPKDPLAKVLEQVRKKAAASR